MVKMRYSGEDRVEPYAERFGAAFHPGKRPWEVPGARSFSSTSFRDQL